jgi:hypothetical protein
MTSSIQQTIRQMKQNPRRSVVMLGLLLVLVGLWVRMLTGGTAPKPASAATGNSKSVATPTKGKSRATTPRPSSTKDAVRDWLSGPVTPLTRNLFAINLELFPPDRSRNVAAETGQDGFWDQLEKSLSVQTDQLDKKLHHVSRVRQEAARLKLQTIIMGSRPRAMVNGGLVGEGDVVAIGAGSNRIEFRVTKIEARRIIVEREGIRLELTMK